MNEEKKLTDEEIVKALKVVGKETLAFAYDKEQKQFKYVTAKEILDLIHRLQAENERLNDIEFTKEHCDLYKENEWLKTEIKRELAEHEEFTKNAKEEIELLTEENTILKGNPPVIAGRSLGKTIRNKLLAFDRMKEQNAELQKQVDELKERLKLAYEDCECEFDDDTELENLLELTKKGTAKEIYQMADEIATGSQNDGVNILTAIKERYGVEVE